MPINFTYYVLGYLSKVYLFFLFEEICNSFILLDFLLVLLHPLRELVLAGVFR